MTRTQRLEQRMQETAQQWAQVHARQLMTHMRARARMKAASRKDHANRCRLLGQLVAEIGDPTWTPAELAGVLVEARESLASPTIRMASRQRGEAHFERLKPAPGLPTPSPS